MQLPTKACFMGPKDGFEIDTHLPMSFNKNIFYCKVKYIPEKEVTVTTAHYDVHCIADRILIRKKDTDNSIVLDYHHVKHIYGTNARIGVVVDGSGGVRSGEFDTYYSSLIRGNSLDDPKKILQSLAPTKKQKICS